MGYGTWGYTNYGDIHMGTGQGGCIESTVVPFDIDWIYIIVGYSRVIVGL